MELLSWLIKVIVWLYRNTYLSHSLYISRGYQSFPPYYVALSILVLFRLKTVKSILPGAIFSLAILKIGRLKKPKCLYVFMYVTNINLDFIQCIHVNEFKSICWWNQMNLLMTFNEFIEEFKWTHWWIQNNLLMNSSEFIEES